MISYLVDLQRWLYSGVGEALLGMQSASMGNLTTLLLTAFGFGAVHAFFPGHGKAVLASYHVGAGGLASAVGSSALLILLHVGSAVVFVLGGFAVVQRTIGGAGRAPALELASQMLIVCVGLWLLWRTARPPSHEHARASAVALAAGIVPCPLTTFVMIYAISKGLVTAGLLLSAAFACGMVLTVSLFPLLVVLFRQQLTRVWSQAGRIGRLLQVGAATAIIVVGLAPLIGRFYPA